MNLLPWNGINKTSALQSLSTGPQSQYMHSQTKTAALFLQVINKSVYFYNVAISSEHLNLKWKLQQSFLHDMRVLGETHSSHKK